MRECLPLRILFNWRTQHLAIRERKERRNAQERGGMQRERATDRRKNKGVEMLLFIILSPSFHPCLSTAGSSVSVLRALAADSKISSLTPVTCAYGSMYLFLPVCTYIYHATYKPNCEDRYICVWTKQHIRRERILTHTHTHTHTHTQTHISSHSHALPPIFPSSEHGISMQALRHSSSAGVLPQQQDTALCILRPCTSLPTCQSWLHIIYHSFWLVGLVCSWCIDLLTLTVWISTTDT